MRALKGTYRALLLLFAGLFLCLGTASATHIVGGELNYERLGGNQYRITLKLYKDCGISIVPFDDPAELYVYDGDNNYLFSIEIPIVERDTLDAAFQDPCLVIPPEICVDFARYETVASLQPSATGYSIAYIRCCRNATILNAIGRDDFNNPLTPDLIGATYWVRIPGTAAPNSNPVFREFPPIIVCSGQEINDDHSATDADGDSLVYSLCTPNVGGALTAVFGDPEVDRPPFEQVEWVPPYGLDNIMGGSPALSIDPRTGILTGRAPEVIGQFVVGVCVQEFRNGVLLSENKRDFQFNIADCRDRIESDYALTGGISIDTLTTVAPDPVFEYILVCDTVPAVQFVNLTEGTDFSVWDFGDGSPELTAQDPYHVFPDTGFYLVSLYGAPGDLCSDTFRQIISIQYQNVAADFSFGDALCYDPNVGLVFEDLTEEADAIGSWAWDFGDGSTSSAMDPVHFYLGDGSYEVSLDITGKNGCRSEKDTVIDVFFLDPFELPDTVAFCGQPSVVLPLEIEGTHSFVWSPATDLDDAQAQQPTASPTEITTYTVTIYSVRPTGDTCLRMAEVVVLPDYALPSLQQLTDPLQCSEIVELSVSTDSDASVLWALSPDFQEVIATTAEFDFLQTVADQQYFLSIENEFCQRLDSVLVEQRAIDIVLEDTALCLGDSILLRAEVTSFGSGLEYLWEIGGQSVSTAAPQIGVRPPGTLLIGLDATNAEGCTAGEFSTLTVYELPDLIVNAAPTEVINSQEVAFEATDDPSYTYSWNPSGLFSDPAVADPSAVISQTGYIAVTVTDNNGCSRSDSILINVEDIPCNEPDVFIPNAFSPNGDALNDIFRVQGVVIESLHLEIFDRWGNGVFEGRAKDEFWDGTYKGERLGSDSFGYVLQIRCYGGGIFVKQGSITLVR